jgi:hypothetical protein
MPQACDFGNATGAGGTRQLGVDVLVEAGAAQRLINVVTAQGSNVPTRRARATVTRTATHLECPRSRGHLIAWVCPAQREGCGVHAQDAPAVPGGVPS